MIRTGLSIALLTAALSACGSVEASPIPTDPVALPIHSTTLPVATLILSPVPASVTINTNITLSAFAFDSTGAQALGRTTTWQSSDSTVASVGTTGIVRGLTLGAVTISATCEGKTTSGVITVKPRDPGPANWVYISPVSPTMLPGATQTFAVTAYDLQGTPITGRPISFVSSDTTVASVTAGGVVTALAAGNAYITATLDGKSAVAHITVLVPVGIVQLTPSSVTVAIGGTQRVTALTEDAATNILVGRTVLWSSANLSIATVDANGLITGVAVGQTTITVKSENAIATLTVTVTP